MNRAIGWLLTLLALIFSASIAQAAQFQAEKSGRMVIAAGQIINDDLYLAGEEIVLEGTVNGDVFVAGGQVRIPGTIDGDLTVAAGEVTLTGTVSDDVRIGAGGVTISGTVGDDLLVGAGQVAITKEGTVGGQIWAGTGQLSIAGTTGQIQAGLDQLIIEPTAKISGDVTYLAETDAHVSPQASVTGKITRKEPPAPPKNGRAGFGLVVSLLITFLMALVVLVFFPHKIERAAGRWRTDFWGSVLWGAILVILTPIAAGLLVISVLGWPLGLAVLLLYPIVLYLGNLVGLLAVGAWLKARIERAVEPRLDWLAALLGLGVMALLASLPLIGWLAAGLIGAAGLGALAKTDWEIIRKLRSDRVL